LYLILIYLLQQINNFYLKFNCRKGGERRNIMTEQKALKIIEGADVYELAATYSEYMAEELSDPDGALYDAEEFDDLMTGFTPSALADMVRYGDYSASAEFFTFDGYGNIESVHVSDVVDFITSRLTDDELKAVAAML